MVMVGVPTLTTLLETVELELDLARLTPTNAAPAATATTAAMMIHFLWLPDPILVVVLVMSPACALAGGSVVWVVVTCGVLWGADGDTAAGAALAVVGCAPPPLGYVLRGN